MPLTGDIDINTETLLTINEAQEWLQAANMRVSADSIRRWMLHGVCGGIQLDGVRIGRRIYTSNRALQDFIQVTSGVRLTDRLRERQWSTANRPTIAGPPPVGAREERKRLRDSVNGRGRRPHPGTPAHVKAKLDAYGL